MASKGKGTQKEIVKGSEIVGKQKKPYDQMNNIIANLLSNLTVQLFQLCLVDMEWIVVISSFVSLMVSFFKQKNHFFYFALFC